VVLTPQAWNRVSQSKGSQLCQISGNDRDVK